MMILLQQVTEGQWIQEVTSSAQKIRVSAPRKNLLFCRFVVLQVRGQLNFQDMQKNLGALIQLHIVSVRDDHGPRGIGGWRRAQAQTFQSKNALRHADTHRLTVRRNGQQRAGAVGMG